MADPTTPPDPAENVPAVLVVLVARDAQPWLRTCLQGLASQTYPRLGVVAVDNASTDGTRELLERALGPRRVLALTENVGVAGSVRAALSIQAARQADHFLIVHDDAALDPDAVHRLVDAMGIEDVERIGVVGPKVVDWDDPRILREVGRSTDRFAHPYTPLQDGELDQGQFDRVLEVLFVSSVAMLVSRDCIERVGPFDERYSSHHEDLDFCWRARVAGFRVLMTPLARVRHLRASSRSMRRTGAGSERSERYHAERAALGAMLKNYGLLSLAWVLPLYAVVATARLLGLALSRRFEDVVELVAAWAWNIVHLPGTLRRRVRAQSVRRVRDRAVRRFMESTGIRFPRWIDAVGRILEEQREIEEEEEEEPVARRLRDHGASLLRAHPVFVATILGLSLGAVAFRDLFGTGPLFGAALPAFPDEAGGFFDELAAGYRSTGLGGTDPASPALALLGGLSTLLAGNTALVQRVALAAGPVLGAVFAYRSLARQTGRSLAGAVGAAAYALSATALWAFSEGRVATLALVAAAPLVADRIDAAFAVDRPAARGRFVVGAAIPLAAATAFDPGTAVAVAWLILARLALGPSRAGGATLSLGVVAASAVLVFPMLPGLVEGGGRALGSEIGHLDAALLARLAPGSAPGSGPLAWFLPASAALALSVASGDHRGRANRAALTAVGALALAWLAAADRLPTALSNPTAYVVAAAASFATVVAAGTASVMGVRSEAFGYRQIGAGALAVALSGGLAGQAAVAAFGDWRWGVSPAAVEPAWGVVRAEASGQFRALWIGVDRGVPFPAPGGDPQGTIGGLAYAVTGRDGATALDLGRSIAGAGEDALRRALAEIISGDTRHGGALLAPFGIRFVVADERDGTADLPAPLVEILGRQVDLDLEQRVGLVVYENARALPPAATLPAEPAVVAALDASEPASIARLPDVEAVDLLAADRSFVGGAGVPFLASEYDPRFRLDPGGVPPVRAFGWAMRWEPQGSPYTLARERGLAGTLRLAALAIAWAAALWITRKPVRS